VDDLDFSKYFEAVALVDAGNVVASINCMCCQGHSLPGAKEGQPGHCGECLGCSYVDVVAWKSWPLEKKLDYWQARALIAEAKLNILDV
jgi:hypothetical protein